MIGAASAAAYLLLYLLLRSFTGAQVANVVALVTTQVANTAVNRRLTFGLRGSKGALGHQLGGLAAFAFGLGLSAGALWLLHRMDPGAGRVAEVAVLVVAQGIATVVRFLTLHAMMARREPGAAPA
ncbi:GtrA-like protein [Microlunatus sagamiharensis]|uniref:GtrA-like protein n=1 Tax=Microlunatus sagamiharensis TaxID=546874 RepID=A0A1H2N237_9ACTN|nr:GtrA-like protein [Microlunatus sagamiharensis]